MWGRGNVLFIKMENEKYNYVQTEEMLLGIVSDNIF